MQMHKSLGFSKPLLPPSVRRGQGLAGLGEDRLGQRPQRPEALRWFPLPCPLRAALPGCCQVRAGENQPGAWTKPGGCTLGPRGDVSPGKYHEGKACPPQTGNWTVQGSWVGVEDSAKGPGSCGSEPCESARPRLPGSPACRPGCRGEMGWNLLDPVGLEAGSPGLFSSSRGLELQGPLERE